MEEVLNTAVRVIADPRAQLFAAFLFVYLLPNNTLKRLPVVGTLAEAAIDAWSRKKLEDAMRKEGFLEAQARQLAEALEQEIKRGSVDQASARNEAMQSMIQRFGLPTEKAARLVESAVFRVNRDKPLVLSEFVPGESA